MRVLILASLAGVIGLMAAGALAAGSPDQEVLARQTALKSIGKTFKEIHTITQGDLAAQRATLVADAHNLKTLAPQPWSHFGPETATTTLKTEALPAIWTNTAGFKADQSKLIEAVAALDAIAATGSADVVNEKVAAVGGACHDCHKDFKAK